MHLVKVKILLKRNNVNYGNKNKNIENVVKENYSYVLT